MGGEPWGEEERETGERQEISGRNKEERKEQRKEGTKGKRREGKIRGTKMREEKRR